MTESNQGVHEEYEESACNLFSSGTCTSCSLLHIEPGKRYSTKLSHVRKALEHVISAPILDAACDSSHPIQHPFGSRTKLKYLVAGTSSNPTIGIVSSKYEGIDLTACPLPPPRITELLESIKNWIKAEHIEPYNITNKSGLLKGIIVSTNQKGDGAILRCVVRSFDEFEKHSASLLTLSHSIPLITVLSVNVQPVHAAIPEGKIEHVLSDNHYITEVYNGLSLSFGPQSFMQVTPQIGEALYGWVAQELSLCSPKGVLDLFCGVGGFGLSVAPIAQKVLGLEISEDAVQAARYNAKRNGINNAEFMVGDLSTLSTLQNVSDFDTVIVNPPRRGLGEELCSYLTEARCIRNLIYSSCNPISLASDLAHLKTSFTPVVARCFDMFPLTLHSEVAVRLSAL